MTQEQRVLNYIREHGSITSMQAFADLKITRLSATRLSARIFNLRAQGYDIENVSHTYKNGQGTTTTYTEYVLVEDQGKEAVTYR